MPVEIPGNPVCFSPPRPSPVARRPLLPRPAAGAGRLFSRLFSTLVLSCTSAASASAARAGAAFSIGCKGPIQTASTAPQTDCAEPRGLRPRASIHRTPWASNHAYRPPQGAPSRCARFLSCARACPQAAPCTSCSLCPGSPPSSPTASLPAPFPRPAIALWSMKPRNLSLSQLHGPEIGPWTDQHFLRLDSQRRCKVGRARLRPESDLGRVRREPGALNHNRVHLFLRRASVILHEHGVCSHQAREGDLHQSRAAHPTGTVSSPEARVPKSGLRDMDWTGSQYTLDINQLVRPQRGGEGSSSTTRSARKASNEERPSLEGCQRPRASPRAASCKLSNRRPLAQGKEREIVEALSDGPAQHDMAPPTRYHQAPHVYMPRRRTPRPADPGRHPGIVRPPPTFPC